MAIAYFCDHCGAEIAPEDTICPGCQQPLASSATLANGTLLNERYALLNEIGAGGFGAVYKARDTQENDRLVAVKQINLQGLSSQEIIEATDAFNREAEILTTLSHPLLPTIFDRFSDPDHWYLVMTYIDGLTLDEYLQQHRVSGSAIAAGLPLGETLEIALRLCDALHYLHGQQPPVIFRDLKPGNIMRTRKGQLYLIDFGIARRFKPGQAKDTIPFGSPGFAAPEQYGRAQTTPQADIYSLGALLYCLITGDDPSEHPFSFPSLHHYAITGTRELNTLIQRMVSPDPISRPANIQVVQAEFRRIQQLNTQANQQGRIWTPPQGQNPPADSSGQQHIFLNPTLSKQQQTRKTTRRAVITTALILGGAAAVGGIAFLANQTPSAVNGVASPPSANQVTPDTQSVNATSEVTPVSTVLQYVTAFWSPDLSYAAVFNANQIEIYHPQSQQAIRTIAISGDLANSNNAAIWWSPDNSKILAQADSGMMYAWNTTNGQQLFTFAGALADYSLAHPYVVDWSPDGQICSINYYAAAQSNNAQLVFLDAYNGRRLFQKNVPFFGDVAWSPDSRYFTLPDASQWLEGQRWSASIWERGTWQKAKAIGGEIPSASDGQRSMVDLLTLAWSPDGQELAVVFGNVQLRAFELAINQLNGNRLVAMFSNINNTLVSTTNLTYISDWSPDKKYLAIYTASDLLILNTMNGQPVQFSLDFPSGSIGAFAWASDGKSINIVDYIDEDISNWSIS